MSVTIVAEMPGWPEVADLYQAVGWTAYTSDYANLMRGIEASSQVYCARLDSSDHLIGMARTLSDGATVTYLQDILIHPGYQRIGVGRKLMETVLAANAGIRQFVLLTDLEPGQRAFYESCGLTEVGSLDTPLRAFVRV